MEDIKILAQYIKSSFRLTLPENVLKAIENLINRNKEQEKLIEREKNINELLDNRLTDYIKYSIPKSEVEKIINELETKKNKHTDYYFNIQEVIRILSKLLEK